MHLRSFAVRNFRRLKRVKVDLSKDATVFVGANNSGKTSAMHIFQLFMAPTARFTIHDFSADCWDQFNKFDPGIVDTDLPVIALDLWFEVDEANLHRVIDLLPDLDWQQGTPVGIRLSFEPKDRDGLHANYLAVKGSPDRQTGYWPRSLYDYLRKRLGAEYHVAYYKLDRGQFNDELQPASTQAAQRLDSGRTILNSILRVDLLQAQRHLSDTEQRGRDEDLSRTLGRFYDRYLDKPDPDPEALQALANSEQHLNAHFTTVFEPILQRLNKLGYPGLANPELMIKSELRGETLLGSGAQVHYVLPGEPVDPADGSPITLPDRYNGLGFKNLIYMVVEILAAHRARLDTAEARPPVHLMMIEEPESHLHAQLQQVFIRQLRSIVTGADDQSTQFVLTTHSSHIVYQDFTSIRYFARVGDKGSFHYSVVRDLSVFYDGTAEESRSFLLQYLKLTHCDLFFADATILVEGTVERLVLPLLISRFYQRLESSHLTILELGGAFAHKFRELVDFLGIPCLIITDLDSVEGPPGTGKACPTDTSGAVTSNETLKQWIPCEVKIEELLEVEERDKIIAGPPGTATVRAAYQTRQSISWGDEAKEIAGRTFEEAFAFENLSWSQDEANRAFKLRVGEADRSGGLDVLTQAIFEKVRALDKTEFALTLIEREHDWACPAYVSEGLAWLADEISDLDAVPAGMHSEGAADEPSTPQP